MADARRLWARGDLYVFRDRSTPCPKTRQQQQQRETVIHSELQSRAVQATTL